MTHIIEVPTDEALVNQAVIVAQLVKTILDRKKALAVDLSERLVKGDKKTAHNLNGEPLGTVSMTDPGVVVQVTNPTVLEAWIVEHYADKIETRMHLGDEAILWVLEHAPHLVEREQVIPEWLRSNVITAAKTQDIPGTTRHRPDGNVTIRPNAHAVALVTELLAGSPIPLLAIEAEK